MFLYLLHLYNFKKFAAKKQTAMMQDLYITRGVVNAILIIFCNESLMKLIKLHLNLQRSYKIWKECFDYVIGGLQKRQEQTEKTGAGCNIQKSICNNNYVSAYARFISVNCGSGCLKVLKILPTCKFSKEH